MSKQSGRSVRHALRRATLASLLLVVGGALFLIAPAWQLPVMRANYCPPQPSAVTDAKPINVNTASEEELMALPGIGPVKAAAILAYREQNGAFSSLEELDQVDGISERMVQDWLALAVAGPAEKAHSK